MPRAAGKWILDGRELKHAGMLRQLQAAVPDVIGDDDGDGADTSVQRPGSATVTAAVVNKIRYSRRAGGKMAMSLRATRGVTVRVRHSEARLGVGKRLPLADDHTAPNPRHLGAAEAHDTPAPRVAGGARPRPSRDIFAVPLRML